MQRPVSSWTKTLEKLGLRRSKATSVRRRHRPVSIENLENRELLTVYDVYFYPGTTSFSATEGTKSPIEIFIIDNDDLEKDVNYTITTKSGDPINGDDFIDADTGKALTGSVTIPAYACGVALHILPVDDQVAGEGDEVFNLTITSGSGYTVGSPNQVEVTLGDNDYEAEANDPSASYAVALVEDVPIGSCGCEYSASITQVGKIVLAFEVKVDSLMNGSGQLTLAGDFGGNSFSQTKSFYRYDTATEPTYLYFKFTFDRSDFDPDQDFAHYEATLTSTTAYPAPSHQMVGSPKDFSGTVYFGNDDVIVSPVPRLLSDGDGLYLNSGKSGGYFSDDGVGGFDTPNGIFSSLAPITGGYQLVDSDGSVSVFDSDGYILTFTDTKGRVTTYSYVTYGTKQLVSQIEAPSLTTTFTYSSGKLVSASNTLGDSISLTYSGDLLSTVTRMDPDGAGPLSAPVTTFAYDGYDRLTSKTTNGLTTTYTYDSTGRIASIQQPDGADSTYVSPEQASVSGGQAIETVTGSDGVAVQRVYDKRRNVTQEIDALGNVTIFERDDNGLLLKKILPDPDGAGPLAAPVYEYTYDSRGNKLTETLPDKSVRTWVYHSTWNEPIQYTDANGAITLYEYDTTYDLLLSKTTVIGAIDDLINLETDDLTTSYTYTPAPTSPGDAPISLMASMTAPDGVVTEYEYDEDGNRTKTTYAVGTADEAYTTATYDSNGNRLTETDELGNTTTYTYDDLNRRTSITSADPDGAGPLTASVKSYSYNVMGLVAIETQNGRTTAYTYDSKGRLSSVTEEDPDDTGPLTSPVTSYTYDTDGNVLTVTDPLGNVTTNTYTDGLLTSVTGEDPDDAGPLTAPVTSYTYDDNGQVLTITDPLSRVTTYEYDNLGRQISVTYPDPDGAGSLDALSETTVYDLFGRGSSKTDTSGVTTTYTYDHEGNLLTEATPLGTTTYTYDELNRRVEVQTADPDGVGALTALTTVYVYSAAGTLVSVTTPVGTTTYGYDYRRRRTSVTQADPDGAGPLTAPVSYTSYDDAGNVLTETDALGNVTSYEYDALNRVIEITAPDPDGAGALTSPVTSYGYDVFGQLVSMTDPNGGVTTYEYDDLGRKITEVSPDPDGAGALTAPEVSYAYDAAGQLVSMTDQLGNVTTYEYDNLGRKMSVTLPDPDGAGAATSPETTYVYDTAGQLTSMTDPLGRTTSYTYDAMGRSLTETLPDPDGVGALTAPVTTYTYDDDGRLESVEDAASQTVSYTYNSAGQIATMTDPTGVTTYTYDDLGRQLTVTEPDPDGAGPLSAPVTTYVYNDKGQLASMSTLDGTTSYEYDNLGRTVKVTMPDPDGAGSLLAAWTVFEYDSLGRTLSETNRLGNETSYDYDNLGRLIKKTDAEGGETEYTYDANGNRLTLTDPEENTTTWTYDSLNRMLTNTNQLSDARTYEYDAAGNLVEYADRNGRVTVYEYDNLQRRTSETWVDGMTTVNTLTYGYDVASQLVSVTDSTASYDFTYDNLGRITSTDIDLAALGYDVVLDQAYDALNRRISLAAEIDGTDDFKNEYAYDFLNRLTQVTQAGQVGGNAVAEKRVDFAYDADDKGLFTSITRYADLAGTDTVATSTYGYDFADRLTSLTYVDGGSNTLAGYTWSYDSVNRITGFTVYGHSAEDATYNYDDTDQLTGADRSGTTSDESYAYDENGNRTNVGYVTGDNNQLTSDGTYNYTYDAEGNRLTKTNILTGAYEVYAWDHRNRLVSVTDFDASDVKQWKIDYGYDAFNNLVSREVDSNGDGTVDASGYFIIDNGQIVLVLDDAGDIGHRTLWGPQVDQLLADENSTGDALWALTDNQNTVRDYVEYDDLLDETTVVNHIAYDAVGKVASETNGALDAFRFRYTAKYVDPLTGLQYNINRWYDPALGRWISQDPIEFSAGDANLYRYVRNGFANGVDPSGLADEAHGPIDPVFNPNKPLGERDYQEILENTVLPAWDGAGFDFAAYLLRKFLGKEKGPIDTSAFSKKIRQDKQYTSFLKEGVYKLAHKYNPEKAPQSAVFYLPDNIPESNEVYWFRVRHFSKVAYALSAFSLQSQDDLAWALGGASYGYEDATLTYTRVRTAKGWCEYEVTFNATMIMWDIYEFPEGDGPIKRTVIDTYEAAHILEKQFGYPAFEHTAKWTEIITATVPWGEGTHPPSGLY